MILYTLLLTHKASNIYLVEPLGQVSYSKTQSAK